MTMEEFIDVANPKTAGSWAEMEIKAAVRGFAVDERFCRFAVIAGAMLSSMTRIVAEGIMSSASWECIARDEGIVDDVVQSCIRFGMNFEAKLSRRGVPPARELIDDLMVALASDGFYDSPDARKYILPSARKYALLNALEFRFPLLPVKYYAANARIIHETDEELALWIKNRLRARADAAVGEAQAKLRKIYDSMEVEFVNNHFTTAVLMK